MRVRQQLQQPQAIPEVKTAPESECDPYDSAEERSSLQRPAATTRRVEMERTKTIHTSSVSGWQAGRLYEFVSQISYLDICSLSRGVASVAALVLTCLLLLVELLCGHQRCRWRELRIPASREHSASMARALASQPLHSSPVQPPLHSPPLHSSAGLSLLTICPSP